MTTPCIELAPAEILSAGLVGIMRTANAIASGRRLEIGRTDLAFDRSVEGALGEYALAAWLDVAYRPEVREPDTDRGDVARHQVRTTTLATGSLIVRENDPETFAYVLVILSVRRNALIASLPGWIDGREAKDKRYWRDRGSAPGIHRSAFFVPQSALRPLDTLPLLDDRAERLAA